jgi:hypothetical protein
VTVPPPTPDPAATPDELAALADELGIDHAGYLDDLVRDAKDDEAAAVNNAGLRDQLVYLCAGMTAAEARDYLEEHCPEDVE